MGGGERVKERKGRRLNGHSEALVGPAVLSHLCLMLFTLPLSSSLYVMAQACSTALVERSLRLRLGVRVP